MPTKVLHSTYAINQRLMLIMREGCSGRMCWLQRLTRKVAYNGLISLVDSSSKCKFSLKCKFSAKYPVEWRMSQTLLLCGLLFFTWCQVIGGSISFTRCKQSILKNEESRAGKFITQVTASSTDGSEIFYAIDPPHPYFKINPTTGLITTSTTAIDKEHPTLKQTPVTSLVVTASSRPPAENAVATCRINVTVIDINDNAPIFTQHYTDITVSPLAEVGDVVATVEARDRDEGKNGRVFYSVEPQVGAAVNFNDYFQVDASSGQVKLVKPVNLSVTPALTRFTARVTASDEGSPPKKSITLLTLQVGDGQNTANNSATRTQLVTHRFISLTMIAISMSTFYFKIHY